MVIQPRMSEIVCPLCGGKLKTETSIHPHENGVVVATTRCYACKEAGRKPYAMMVEFSDSNTRLEIQQMAKVIYAEAVKKTIGKKWVEIEDTTPMGNYYGSGGEWVECPQADGEMRTESAEDGNAVR